MEEKEPEIVTIVFGSAGLYLPKSLEWITKVRKLLDLIETDLMNENEPFRQEGSKEHEESCGCSYCKLSSKPENPKDAPGHAKTPQNVPEVKTEAVRQPGDKGVMEELTIEGTPIPQETGFLLIPKFAWDKSKEKSYRTIFFVEEEDGRVGILYFNFKTFTTKEAVLSIPFPVPYGYTPLKSFSGNRKAAIRLYREYLFNEARNAEVPGAIKRDEEQEEKDATKREEAPRRKAEINATRWKGDKSKREMSVRTKELRDGVVAKMMLGVGADKR